MKKCTKCKKYKDESEFSSAYSKSNPLRLRGDCRACSSEVKKRCHYGEAYINRDDVSKDLESMIYNRTGKMFKISPERQYFSGKGKKSRRDRSVKARNDFFFRIVDGHDYGCSCCGSRVPYQIIDYHHVDPEEKDGSPSNYLKKGRFSDAYKELAKTVPLCRNCHSLTHLMWHRGFTILDGENSDRDLVSIDEAYRILEDEYRGMVRSSFANMDPFQIADMLSFAEEDDI